MSDVEFIHDAVSRVLADTVTLASIQEAEKRKVPIQLFDALADTGISLMLAPEEYGGVNANLSAALSVLRAAGAAAAPGPVLETILAQRLLTQAGLGPTGGLSPLLFAQPLDGPAPGAGFWEACAWLSVIAVPGAPCRGPMKRGSHETHCRAKTFPSPARFLAVLPTTNSCAPPRYFGQVNF